MNSRHASDRLPAYLALTMNSKLAWSNTGSIARIKDHGRKIVFHTLRRDSHSGSWSLTRDSKEVLAPSAGARWEHIQFSNLGIDLAAVDTLGRVTIYTLTGALGKMQVAPHSIVQSELPRSDSDAVVGLHWLPVWPNEFRVSEHDRTDDSFGRTLTIPEVSEHFTGNKNRRQVVDIYET